MRRILSFMGSNKEFMAYLKGLKQTAYLELIEYQPRVINYKNKKTPWE